MGRRCHPDQDEMIKKRKFMDNKKTKLKRWLDVYGLVINEDDYDVFSENSILIKKIIPILDVVQRLRLVNT